MTQVEHKAFELDAGAPLTATQTQRGDLVVSGMAAVWKGLDREQENFVRGAFKDAIRDFLTRPSGAPLVFHHRKEKTIGRVLDLRETDEGLAFKALVTRQAASSPLFYIFDGIRRGLYKGVSVGGIFTRRLMEGGLKIAKADLTEISITPLPVHPGTYALATEVKALQDFCAAGVPPTLDDAAAELRELERSMLLWEGRQLVAKLDGLRA